MVVEATLNLFRFDFTALHRGIRMKSQLGWQKGAVTLLWRSWLW